MQKTIKLLRTGICAAFIFTAAISTASAQENDSPFMNLNPYSELYLTCEELADEVAPIGYTTEHEDWKVVFRNCIKSTLEIEPAAGAVLPSNNANETAIDESTNSLTIQDVERDNLITDDYGEYQREMLGQDSTVE